MALALGAGTAAEFFENEFEELDLSDLRLVERAKRIMITLQSKLGSCIRRTFIEPKEARQAYDFFSNPKVLSEKMLKPHYKQTIERIKHSDSKYILAIQDGMRLNYTKHLAKTEIGRIGKTGKTDQYGLIQHSTLCVTEQNEPLGLIDVQFFHYDEIDTSTHHHHRACKDKASRCWVKALNHLNERLKGTEKRVITVADREGDFYEFLHALMEGKKEFVIRAQHDRYTGEKHRSRDEKLWTLLDKEPIYGTREITIQDVNTREMKTINLQLKRLETIFPSPNKSKEEQIGKINYEPIKVNVVKAYNEEYEWVLLTSLPIDTLEQLEEVITIYRARWHIEDYHKVLKTGYQVDEIYLHSSREAIENLLTMASISACRLYWIIYIGRTEGHIKADQIFEEFEWKAMYVYFKESIPEEAPALSEIILKIARLGGYKLNTGAQPPGIKTMWVGFQQFTVAAQMYRHMST